MGRYLRTAVDYYIKYPDGSVILGDKAFCVQDGPFTSTVTGAACAENEHQLKFFEFTVPATVTGTFTTYITNGNPDEANLPVGTSAGSEAQSMYDACAKMWNEQAWKTKPGNRALAAKVKHHPDGSYVTGCYGSWGGPDIISQLQRTHQECQQDGWTCYDFARNTGLVPWAWREYWALHSGQRK